MVFCKGAISYDSLIKMPIPEIYELQFNANKIVKEIEAQRSKKSS